MKIKTTVLTKLCEFRTFYVKYRGVAVLAPFASRLGVGCHRLYVSSAIIGVKMYLVQAVISRTYSTST